MANLQHDFLFIVHVASQGENAPLAKLGVSSLLFDSTGRIYYQHIICLYFI